MSWNRSVILIFGMCIANLQIKQCIVHQISVLFDKLKKETNDLAFQLQHIFLEHNLQTCASVFVLLNCIDTMQASIVATDVMFLCYSCSNIFQCVA